ncbi:MAG: M1 family aminopeptidase [Bryobacteraceae bacterium]
MMVARFAVMALALATLAAGQERRSRIDVEHYDIDAEINQRTQSLEAKVKVRFRPVDENIVTAAFELNNALKVSAVEDAKGNAVPFSASPQDFTVRLNFSEPVMKDEAATVTFHYGGRLSGSEDSPVYGIRFASIQNDYAYLLYPSRWFPVNGYTTDRYSAKMNITVADGYRVVSSGIDTSQASAGKAIYSFQFDQASFPGSLAVVRGDPARVPSEGVTTSLYFRGDEAAMAGAYGQEAGKIMTHFTGLFGLPPYANLTIVQTENGAPNGYAAPGVIFLSPRAIGKQVGSKLLANQISRQWWSNLLSPATRNHLWLSNGLAAYSEMLWVEQSNGPAALEAEARDAFVESLTIDDVPIIQAARLEDYAPELWALTASKGAAVLHMLRAVIGDEKFFQALKDFAGQNARKPVSTDDLRKVVENASQQSLQYFFIQWIESSGAPEFKLEYTIFRTQEGFRVIGKVSQDLDTFRMPVDLRVETEGNPEDKKVEVVGTSSEFVVETFGKPRSIVLDPNNRVLRFNNDVRLAVAIRRGEQFAELSDFGEALKEYQRALEANRYSSLAHYRIGELFFLQNNYQSAANEFREALNGDLEPKWTEVWAHINLGKIFDITQQRERAINEYNQAVRTKDNTQGAQEEAAKYLKTPYERQRRSDAE